MVTTPTTLVIATSKLATSASLPVTGNWASKANIPPIVLDAKYCWKLEVAATGIAPGGITFPFASKNVYASCDAE